MSVRSIFVLASAVVIALTAALWYARSQRNAATGPRAPELIRLLEDALELKVENRSPEFLPALRPLFQCAFSMGMRGLWYADSVEHPCTARPAQGTQVRFETETAAPANTYCRLLSSRGVLICCLPALPGQDLQFLVRVRATSQAQNPRSQVGLTVMPLPFPADSVQSLEGRTPVQVLKEITERVKVHSPRWIGPRIPIDGQFVESRFVFRTAFDTQALLVAMFDREQTGETTLDLDQITLTHCPARVAMGLSPHPLPEPDLRTDCDHKQHGIRPADRGAGPEVVRVRHLGEERTALLLPPPAVAGVLVRLPEGPLSLEFGYGILHERRPDWRERPLWLNVAIQKSANAEAVPIFETTLQGEDPPGWIDRTLDISAFAGRQVRILFRVGFPPGRSSADVVLLGNPVVRTLSPSDDLPKVILVSIDTLRADRLSAEGYPRPTTPHLDALARKSLWFRQAMSTSSYTLPAHATMMTGQGPDLHGVHGEVGGRNRLSPRRSDLLAELLSEHRFHTAAWVGGAYLSGEFGFSRGFDRYNELDPILALENSRWDREPVRLDRALNERVRDRSRMSSVIDWIRERRAERFFVFLHTYQVHDYVSAERFRRTFATSHESELGDDLGWLRDRRRNPMEISTADLQHYQDRYDAALRQADEAIGELVSFLERSHLLDQVILIVTSDHGEEFLDHGGLVHGRQLYGEMTHVPLIVHLPGLLMPQEIHLPVSLTDIAPTVLERLKIAGRRPMDGTSLFSPVAQRANAALGASLRLRPGDEQQATRRGPWKLLERRVHSQEPEKATYQLFRADSDPLDTLDFSSELPEKVAEIQGEIAAWRQNLDRVAGQLEVSPEAPVDPATRAALEEIGYESDKAPGRDQPPR